MGLVEVGGNGSIDWRVDHGHPNKSDIDKSEKHKVRGRDPVNSADIQPPDGPKGDTGAAGATKPMR